MFQSVEEDLTGVKELVKTPKTKGEPVQNKFGISKLMKTPRQKGAAAVEDFEGVQDLLQEPEEPEADITPEPESNEAAASTEEVQAEGEGGKKDLACLCKTLCSIDKLEEKKTIQNNLEKKRLFKKIC